MKYLQSSGAAAIDVAADVQAASYARVQSRMKRTVWSSGCRSWYLSEDGRSDILWPGTTIEYWARTRRFRARDFEVLDDGAPDAPAPAMTASGVVR
jgi:hypothetical protein